MVRPSESSDEAASGVSSRNYCERLNDSFKRLRQNFKDRTIRHVRVRWYGFSALLFVFLLRIWEMGGFFLCPYIVGIALLGSCAQFWSPLNDVNIVLTLDANAQPRRFTEYKLWAFNTTATLICLIMTFFSIFDIPVYWPILLCYWGFLGIFQLGNVLYRRRAASQLPETFTNVTEKTLVKFSFNLKFDKNVRSLNQVYPWNAIRTVPAFCHMTPETWSTFISDLDAALLYQGNMWNQIRWYWAKLIAIFYASVYLDEFYFREPIFAFCAYIDYFESSCSLPIALSVLLLPTLLYGWLGGRSLRAQVREERSRANERVKQICASAQNPHVQIHVQATRNQVVVMVRPAATANAPNWADGVDVPLLVGVV